MSEINPTPEELIEEIELEVADADVVEMPIDPTLTIQGEAADAKATGDAIAAVIGNLRVNEKAPAGNAITLYAGDIKMSDDEGAATITEAIDAAGDKGADDIMYNTTELVTVKDALDDIYASLDSELSEAEIDNILDSVFGGEN